MSTVNKKRRNNNNRNQGGGGGGGGGRQGRGGNNIPQPKNNNTNHGGNHKNNSNKNQGGPDKSMLRTTLKLVFEKQKDQLYGEDNVLRLDAFRDCPDLSGVRNSIDFNTAAFCDSLCSVMKEFVPQVQFVSLANNHIKALNFFLEALLRNNFQDVVRGFNLDSNKINEYDFVAKLAKFSNVIEVAFTNNPIAARGDYPRPIIKRVSQLMGLDGSGINRMPLALPWPVPSTYSEVEQQILMFLESHLHGLGGEGPNGNALLSYDAASYFSISMQADMPFHVHSRHRGAQNALNGLKQNIRDKNRNLVQVTGNTANRIARGRSQVGALLGQVLYPDGLMARHELDANASIQILQGDHGVKGPMIVVTIHGVMMWRHASQQENERPTTACFDRTFVIIENPDWKITNDMVTLRTTEPAGVLICQAPHRLEAMSGRLGVPTEALVQIAANCSSDTELAQAAAQWSASQ